MFSDFDGTLAPIVLDPTRAVPPAEALRVLGELVRWVGRVGVISGRPGAYLHEHLGGRGLHLSGLYGLETVRPDGQVTVVPEAIRWAEIVDQVASTAESPAPAGVAMGIEVERKGLAVTLHYRRCPDLAEAAHLWAERAARRAGLGAHTARMAVELRPPVVTTKGTALAQAAVGLDPVCFFGDDFADLEAFDALDELAAQGVTVVRVAVASPEGPPSLMQRADVIADGVGSAVGLLAELLAGLQRDSGATEVQPP